MKPHDIKPVSKEPDIAYEFGKAWLVDVDALRNLMAAVVRRKG